MGGQTMVAEAGTFETTELTPLIGTEIRSDVETLLSGRRAQDIRRILSDRGVIVLPRIGFDEAQQVAFTKTLGALAIENYGTARKTEDDAVVKISLDTRVNVMAEGLRTSIYWHLDGSLSETPIFASLLMPVKLSEQGGQTEFANTYAAYDALPNADKAAIDGLRVVHANWVRDRFRHPEPSLAHLERQMAVPDREQPLVWTHRSGRKSLVIGLTASHIVGMDPRESHALLVRLRDWATQPRFVYHHDWTMGDMVMWDNTSTLHRVLPYDPDCGRLMNRTMLEGEEPFA